MEEWKIIEDYPNYMVSNMGRVKSLERIIMRNNGQPQTINEKILKSCKDGGGYLYIDLYKDGKGQRYKIHRLVAQSFMPNPNNFSEINHIDEDKTNNSVDNLEWCNRIYNLNYGTHNERMAKTKSMPVLQFSKTGDFIKKWDSATEASRVLGINQGSICMCCRGKRCKSVAGYIWQYADDYERIPFEVFDLEIYRKKTA